MEECETELENPICDSKGEIYQNKCLFEIVKCHFEKNQTTLNEAICSKKFKDSVTPTHFSDEESFKKGKS